MKNLIFPLFRNWFLRATCVVIHDLPSSANYVKRGICSNNKRKGNCNKNKMAAMKRWEQISCQEIGRSLGSPGERIGSGSGDGSGS